MASEALSEVQVAEIKKAFAICDRDGNGIIDAAELREVITNITDEEPSQDELQKIMLTVDKNGDGKIEWDEFLVAMTGWLQEDFKVKAVVNDRKRKNPEKERQDVHKKIKSFFQQFKRDSQFDYIRKQLQEHAEGEMNWNTVTDIMDVQGQREGEKLSSDAKLKFLQDYRVTVQNLPYIFPLLVDPFRQIEAISCVTKLLSIVEVFRTPLERRSVADDIVQIFEAMVRASVLPTLVRLADSSPLPGVQLEALRALTLFAPGPRIASTPEDSLLHPSQMFFKRLLIAENALLVALNLLRVSPLQEIREQAVLFLGAIAAHNAETRDFVIRSDAIVPILAQISTQAPITMLRKASWVLSLLCGVSHSLKQLPPWHYIAPVLQPLASLLFVNDEEVLSNVCPALSIVLPGVPEMVVCRRLVELVREVKVPRVQMAALSCITRIVRFDNMQTTMFLHHCGLLLPVAACLQSGEMSVRAEALDLLLVLVGLKGEIQAVLQSGIVRLLIGLLKVDDYLKFNVAKVLKYITRGSSFQIGTLVQQGIVAALCRSLAFFKSYDQVLVKVYKYCGPSYNFEFARDILIALDNIVNVGEMEAEQTARKINVYALEFDMECIDKLAGLMRAIAENPHTEEVNAWRLQRAGEPGLEDRVHRLLSIIKKVQVANSAASTVSKSIVNMIDDLFSRYFKASEATHAPMLIKAAMGEDIRVISAPRNISYADLKKGLEFKYGVAALILRYEDEEGDNITIDSQQNLESAIERFRNQHTVKIQVLEPEAPPDMQQSALTDIPVVDPTFGSPTFSQFASPFVPPRDPHGQNTAVPLPIASAGATSSSSQLHSSGSSLNPLTGSPMLHGTRKRPPEEAQDLLTLPPKRLFEEDNPANFTFNLEQIRREETKHLFESLATSTHFGAKELELLFDKWKDQSSNGGELSREQFATGLRAIGIQDPLIIEQYFSAFDVNKDGKINFREFVTGLSVVQRGTVEERLHFMFKAYDTDGNGVLSPEEVYNLIKATAASRGQNLAHDHILQLVQRAFAEADVNHDGQISYDEFKQAVLASKLVIDYFVNLPF